VLRTNTLLVITALIVAIPARAGLCPCEGAALRASDTLRLFMQSLDVGTVICQTAVDSSDGSITSSTLTNLEPPPNMTGLARMSVSDVRCYDHCGRLSWKTQQISSRSGTTVWELLPVEGKASWDLSVTVNGNKTTKRVKDVGESFHTTCGLIQGMARKTMRRGLVFRDSSVLLNSGQGYASTTTCISAPQDSGRLIFSSRDEAVGRDARLEYDTMGHVTLVEVPPLFVARSVQAPVRDTATSRPAQSVGFLDQLRIPASRSANPDECIVVRLRDGAQLDSSVRSMYCRTDSGWVLRRQDDTCNVTPSTLSANDLRTFTSATPTMQCSNSQIVSLSRRVLNGGSDPCEAIATLTNYVYRSIRKRDATTFSNALETLENGYGDCGEHAVLLGALLRAAGIPARVVYGLVFVGEKRGYTGHAWVIAHTGSWVSADPALGRFPAASDRIPLAIDDAGENGLVMVRLLSRISVNYVQSKGACRAAPRPNAK